MFFKNHLITLALLFLWAGLVLGLFHIFCKFVIRLFRNNVYVTNIVGFCFWLAFGFVFSRICIVYYDYSFCMFGLFSMIVGFVLTKISVDFFFTKFAKLIYNRLTKKKRGKQRYEQLCTNQKA